MYCTLMEWGRMVLEVLWSQKGLGHRVLGRLLGVLLACVQADICSSHW